MIMYLTSDPFDRKENRFRTANGFTELLLHDIKNPCNVLYICADPHASEKNEADAALLFSCLEKEGIALASTVILDERNKADAETLVISADLIVLGDGDIRTQIAFFEEIELQLHLYDFDGVLLGIGSGSVNAAVDVLVQPCDGRATDLFYETHIYGLSLTRVSVIPHYLVGSNDNTGEDLYSFEKITYRGEVAKKLFAIPDGSFFLCEGAIAVLFGEGYLIEDDCVIQCCRENECYRPDLA